MVGGFLSKTHMAASPCAESGRPFLQRAQEGKKKKRKIGYESDVLGSVYEVVSNGSAVLGAPSYHLLSALLLRKRPRQTPRVPPI